MGFPDRNPVLDKYRAPMGPEILSSTGAGVCRKAPKAFPASSSALDKFQSARSRLGDPAATRVVSHSTRSDGIAQLFCFLNGVSHKYHAVGCKMGDRKDVPV